MAAHHSTLMVHAGGHHITREALARIAPPPATYTWKPIKHSDYVEAIHAELATRQIQVTREEYAVQKDHLRLFGVMDLAFQGAAHGQLRAPDGRTDQRDVPDSRPQDTFAAALAFRHSNDKSEAVKMYAGVRVFACDNLALSGDEIILNHKHSVRFDLAEALPEAFDRYHEGELALTKSIDQLRSEVVTGGNAHQLIYDVFRKKLVPLRLFYPVIAEWEGNQQTPEAPGSTWQLLNCFTAHTKVLPAGPQLRCMQRLGGYFQLGKPVRQALVHA